MADSSYSPKVYKKQGGNELVVASGGVVTVESGGILEVNTGGTITVNGDDLIAEIAALSGLDSGELGVINGVTPGTGAASKALILDAGEDIVLPATGVFTYGVLKDPAGTTLGATVADINAAAALSKARGETP